ncbi:Uncharacterised protein [Escherichia coli]|nr:Uncharacterised protein [Escherichia coli]
MTALAAEFFTLDEVNRLKIIQDVIDRRLTTQMAAQRLGISDRQCRRLLARYREDGPIGMTSRRRGKSSNNQWHCCKVSDEAAFCLIQRPYISKTLLTRRISPRGSP